MFPKRACERPLLIHKLRDLLPTGHFVVRFAVQFYVGGVVVGGDDIKWFCGGFAIRSC